MSFADTEPLVRTVLFAGILTGAAVLCWWALTSLAQGMRQLTVVALALATIPAAVVAPFDGGDVLTFLGLISVAAFIAGACGALVPEPGRPKATAPSTVAPGAGAPPAASPTRVASSAATAVLPQPASEHTVSLAAAGELPSTLAYLVEYSRDGRPHRLGFDTHIGRDVAMGIRLEGEGVSREHARIKFENGSFVLYDLGSTNGTRLVRAGRRRKLGAPAPLQDLDVIELGSEKLVFLGT